MAEKVPQTRANHARLDPGFHFVLLPLFALLTLWFIAHFVRHPGTESAALLILCALLLLTVFKMRQYSLKVQDRVIRLEERLRLAQLLPESMRQLSSELTESQLIALRFASDAEYPALAERAAREKLSSKQIKDAVQNWRADYWRV